MKAIRGATTISEDSGEQVRERVKELLLEIKSENNLDDNDVVCIMFSSTNDIHSFYPAKAAREAGYVNCALYSSLEPDVEGSLEKCIRVMILVNNDNHPHHVYLHQAQKLRRDISKVINIAVDGPAGSGKSTVSKLIAKKLDILYLDTGAMYRAVALKCIRKNIDYCDKDAVGQLVENIDLKIEYKDGKQLTILDGEDVSDKIRTAQVSMLSSYVSAFSCVRNKMVDLQRTIAKRVSCILDGRDIGTNVLPDCEFKFYVTASAEVRAKRRYEEDKAKGSKQTYEEILNDINERDYQDKNRAVAPLKQAQDALMVDTSDMNINEVVHLILSKIQEKI
jgi:cytidylate kinase